LTEVEVGPYKLGIAGDFGPRIVSLRRGDSPELLAKLGDEHALEHPGGIYRFHGGHRLWAAPEYPEITYANDDHKVKVSFQDGRVNLLGPPDGAGLTKSIFVSRNDDSLLIDHRITGGDQSRQLAAWAITQFPLGGTAILPFVGDDTGPRPNRSLVLWPYTNLNDPRLRFMEGGALITSDDGLPLKLGFGPMPQRLGYFREGWLFMKENHSIPGETVPDFGATNQVYVGQGFCELESVGELVDVSEQAAFLSEIWSVLECEDETAALELVLGGHPS